MKVKILILYYWNTKYSAVKISVTCGSFVFQSAIIRLYTRKKKRVNKINILTGG